jgi:RNase P/RNase MRP subunit p30
MVFFDGASRNLRFSHTFARLLRGAIELNLVSDLINRDDGWAFTRVRKAIRIASEHHAKIVLSSGARSFEMIRSPFQLSALAITLGLNTEESIRAVSSTPSAIVAANRTKRASEYVEEGVKIVVRSRH